MNRVINKLHYLGFFALMLLSSFLVKTERQKWLATNQIRQLRSQVEVKNQLLLFSQNLRSNIRGSLLFQNQKILLDSQQLLKSLQEKLSPYEILNTESNQIGKVAATLLELQVSSQEKKANSHELSSMMAKTEQALDSLEKDLMKGLQSLMNDLNEANLQTDRLQIQASWLTLSLTVTFMLVLWLLAFQGKSKEKLSRMIAASEQLHRLIFSSMVEGVFLCTAEGVISTHNNQGAKLMGKPGKDLKGLFFSSLLPKLIDENGKDLSSENSPLELLFKSKKPITGGIIGYRDSSGQAKWLSVNTQPLLDETKNTNRSFLITLSDISDRVRAQKTIDDQRAQITAKSKLSALGEMATGIAHEINNPLALILMETEGLQEKAESEGLAKKEDILSFAERVSDTVFKMSKIIKGIKTFARNGEQDEMSDEPLEAIVEDSLTLLKHRLSEKLIEMKIDIEPKDLTLPCRPTQIAQILVNLISNAIDALSELPMDENNPHWVKLTAEAEDQWVYISVENSGPKIPEAIQGRLFQSFFTTKEVGKGTGLGLSLSRNLARSHGGDLYLDSKSNSTRFTFYLPRQVAKTFAA